jgi:Glutamate 5-kinase
LLFAGIKNIEGSFTYGDVVEIKNFTNQVLGRGIINIPSRIIKLHLHNHGNRIEGFPFEAIHRNDMILEK